MSLKEQMENGLLYCEYGHADEEDKAYERIIEKQREHAKDIMFDYNNTRPSDLKTKNSLLKKLLGSMEPDIWVEAPAHFSYGCNTYIGHHFYSNFNLVVVDDGEVHIGNYVMCAPNVTISTTGHPVYGEYRRDGTQFSLAIHIGNDVWLGANCVILPGVTIGNNVVIGAGSVVTHDIPDNVVAVGSPCRVIREITDYDKEYYRRNCPVNHGWNK